MKTISTISMAGCIAAMYFNVLFISIALCAVSVFTLYKYITL